MYESPKRNLGGKLLFIGALPPKYRITLSYAYSSMAAWAANRIIALSVTCPKLGNLLIELIFIFFSLFFFTIGLVTSPFVGVIYLLEYF